MPGVHKSLQRTQKAAPLSLKLGELGPIKPMKCRLTKGEVNYEVRGSGRPLLVLHGGYLDHRHIVNVMEPSFNESSKWQRVYPDLPGHGQTSISDSIQNHNQVLDVLSEFIANICPNETYAVAGESRGGFLARGLTVKEPEKIDGLLLIVPGRYAVADPTNLPTKVTLESADELLPELKAAGYEFLTLSGIQTLDRR